MQNMQTFTQKENMYLHDLKKHEEYGVKTLNKSIAEVEDQELRDLLTHLVDCESKHVTTLSDIMNGNVQMANSQRATDGDTSEYYNKPQPNTSEVLATPSDVDICFTLLNGSKFSSGMYNTAIFEFNNHEIRKILNHIQKEKQQTGEKIYNYLKSKNAYNPPQS